MAETRHPYKRQETDYYCGPAVAQMILAHFGITAAQTDIAKELETDHSIGTSAKELQAFFTRRDFTVSYKNSAHWEDIGEELARGSVVVGYIEQGGDPHYALVTAITANAIVLNDPWHGETFTLNKEEFLGRWRDIEPAYYGEQMLMTITKYA